MTLDLDEIASRVGRRDEVATRAATERHRQLAKPAGALGRLEELGIWLSGVQGRCPPARIERPRLVIVAGDHGVARAGVSAYPSQVTAEMVSTFLAGRAAANVLARVAGASIRVVDMAVDAETPPEISGHKVRRASGRIDLEDALSRDEAERAILAGVAIADEEIDSGADLLMTGDMGIGNTTPAAVLTAACTRADSASVVGRGTGIDDRTWMRKAAIVRDALRRVRPLVGDPVQLLATGGGADFAALVGFLLAAASRRTPVLLDGVVSGSAALIAAQLAPAASDWWLAGHRSPEPAHALALDRLGLQPVLDLQMRLGEGTGALVALPVLHSAVAVLREMATFDEAGVTDRA